MSLNLVHLLNRHKDVFMEIGGGAYLKVGFNQANDASNTFQIETYEDGAISLFNASQQKYLCVREVRHGDNNEFYDFVAMVNAESLSPACKFNRTRLRDNPETDLLVSCVNNLALYAFTDGDRYVRAVYGANFDERAHFLLKPV